MDIYVGDLSKSVTLVHPINHVLNHLFHGGPLISSVSGSALVMNNFLILNEGCRAHGLSHISSREKFS